MMDFLTDLFESVQAEAAALSNGEVEGWVALGQLLTHYDQDGVIHSRTGSVTCARCFLKCGVAPKNDNPSLEFLADKPLRWVCRFASCERQGDAISLCDFLEDGEPQEGN